MAESKSNEPLDSFVLVVDKSFAPRFEPYFVIALQLLTIAAQAIFTFVAVYLVPFGTLSVETHSLYVVGTTVLATIIVRFTTGQMKKLWMLDLFLTDANTGKGNIRARSLLGLGSFSDQFKVLDVTTTLIITGLMTAAIVAGVTPTSALSFHIVRSYLNNNTFSPFDGPYTCFITTQEATSGFSWSNGDGTFLTLNTTVGGDDDCPISWTKDAMAMTSYTQDHSGFDDQYAYTVGTTQVQRGAVGTPCAEPAFGFIGSISIPGSSIMTGSMYNWATQCLPLVVRNPVECHVTGSVTTINNNITVTADGCTVTAPLDIEGSKGQRSVVSGACTDGLEIGKATLAIGAVGKTAGDLSTVMYDRRYANATPDSYAVACSIDFSSAVSFQTVNYSGVNNGLLSGPSIITSNGQSCVPKFGNIPWQVSDFLTNYTLAMGAVGPALLISANDDVQGYPALLFSQALNAVTIPDYWGVAEGKIRFMFNSSGNPLEDALGMICGISMGFAWGLTKGGYQGTEIDNGQAAALGVRVGSGQPWTIVYILPGVYAIATITYLLWRLDRHKSTIMYTKV